MKKVLAVLVLGFLFCAGMLYAAEQGSMISIEPPQLTQVQGTGEASLNPSIFPNFVLVEGSDNDDCVKAMVKELSGKSVCNIPSVGGGKGGNPACSNKPKTGFVPLQGLVKDGFIIPEQYRKTAKILVTWTVRIVGGTWDVSYWPSLCDPFHGTKKFSFPSGTVDTKLFINGEETKKVFSMQVPEGGYEEGPSNSDPTLTGHFLISPSDYPEKTLPATLKIEVYWQNNTCMILRSPKKEDSAAGDRTMIINFMPVGGNPAKN